MMSFLKNLWYHDRFFMALLWTFCVTLIYLCFANQLSGAFMMGLFVVSGVRKSWEVVGKCPVMNVT